MSKSSKTNNWVKRHSKDPFVKKSRTDRYRSRAAYKLKSIDEKYDVLKNVQCVVDLGCAPGSWLQVLQEHSNIREIFGIDVLDLDLIKGVNIYKKDIRDHESLDKIFTESNIEIDLVLSDIAPNITGISDIDQSNFAEIAEIIQIFCKSRLKFGGTMVMKYFLGSSFDATVDSLRNNFKKINVFKPSSSKKKSNEVYLVCIDFKA